MASSIDEKLDRGRAVWEMTQTEGWQIIKNLIDQELEIESKDLLDCPIEEDLEHKNDQGLPKSLEYGRQRY